MRHVFDGSLHTGLGYITFRKRSDVCQSNLNVYRTAKMRPSLTGEVDQRVTELRVLSSVLTVVVLKVVTTSNRQQRKLNICLNHGEVRQFCITLAATTTTVHSIRGLTWKKRI